MKSLSEATEALSFRRRRKIVVCVGPRDFAATNFLSLPKTALS
jgi:hypothetical protein